MSRLELVTECQTCNGLGHLDDTISAIALCHTCEGVGASRTPLDPDGVIWNKWYNTIPGPKITVQDVLDALEAIHESS